MSDTSDLGEKGGNAWRPAKASDGSGANPDGKNQASSAVPGGELGMSDVAKVWSARHLLRVFEEATRDVVPDTQGVVGKGYRRVWHHIP
jgi:hypothetical protein